MNLDAVIFDWGGTLTPWHDINPGECWLTVVGDPARAQALIAAEEQVWLTMRDHHRSGSVDQIARAAGVELTEVERRAYYQWWDAHSYTDPEVPALFAALHARDLRIGILSNTVWPALEHQRIFARDEISHLIDGEVYSSEIEWTKPHPEAFRAALAAVGVTEPSRAVYVGDRLFEDVHGANQIGMRSVFIPHSDIPAQQKTGVEGTPDAVVHTLSELVPVIDSWL